MGRYDALEEKALKETSLNTKLAVASVPVLLTVAGFAIVHIDDTSAKLVEINRTGMAYSTYAAELAAQLQQERDLLVNHIMSDVASTEVFHTVKRKVDKAMSKFAKYHFSHSDDVSDKVLDMSSEPLDGPERHLNLFTSAIKQEELETMRMLAQEYHYTGDLHVLEEVTHLYDVAVRDLFVMAGRRSGQANSPFSQAQLGVLGYLDMVTALAQMHHCSVWVSSVHTIAEHDEAVRALAEASAKLGAAKSLLETYATEGMLRDLTFLMKEHKYFSYIDHVSSSIQEVYHTSGIITGNESYFSCDAVRSYGFANASQIHEEQDELIAEHKKSYVMQLVAAILILVVCGIGVILHLLSVKSYFNMMNQVLQSKREVEKLVKSLDRMKQYSSLGLQDHDEAESEGHFIKRKGIPAAEKALFSVSTKLRHIRNYLPKSLFCERFIGENDEPFTDLVLKPVKNVTVLTCCIGFLNAVSPQEEVPVKQKALEKAMGGALVTILQTSSERGGSVTDVTADYVTVCWNLLTKRPKGQYLACATAVDLTDKLHTDGTHASMGIATGDVLAGNVGVESLKSFVCIGPTMSTSRQIEQIAGFYKLAVVIDAPTAEEVQTETEVQTMPMDVITSGGGAPDADPVNLTLFSLTAKNVSEDQDKNQHWNRMFSHYHDGCIRQAKDEAAKFGDKHGSTPILKRFITLCLSHPHVPPRNVFDLFERHY